MSGRAGALLSAEPEEGSCRAKDFYLFGCHGAELTLYCLAS